MKSVVAALFCFITTCAHAQQMTREQTLSEVSRSVEEIQRILPPQSGIHTSNLNFEEKIKLAVEKASALQEKLKASQYIRLKGFTIGVPSGMSLEFEFIPASN